MAGFLLENGGQRGIRTLVTFNSKHAFQACAIDHSAICPDTVVGRAVRRIFRALAMHFYDFFALRVASLKRTPKILLRANGRVPLPHKRRHHGDSHEYE